MDCSKCEERLLTAYALGAVALVCYLCDVAWKHLSRHDPPPRDDLVTRVLSTVPHAQLVHYPSGVVPEGAAILACGHAECSGAHGLIIPVVPRD